MMQYRLLSIPFPLRLALFLAGEAAGTALEFLLPGPVPGAVVCAAFAALMLAKGYTTKPDDLGEEDWQPVTDAEVTRVEENIRETRKMRRPVYAKAGARLLVVLAFVVAFFFSLGSRYAPVLWFDALVVLVPYFFSGGFRLWTPLDLRMKLLAFAPFLENPVGPEFVLTPYLRLDRDAEGRRIPEDIRMTLEPKRKPGDFETAQFQVAINNGPNGPVPYLYVVFLCRGAGASWNALYGMKFPGYVVEKDAGKDYATVVVRHETGGTGYHTTANDCKRLYDLVRDALTRLARKS